MIQTHLHVIFQEFYHSNFQSVEIANITKTNFFDIAAKLVLSSIFVCNLVINPSSSFGYL